ncbi:MAG: hypothetical protein M3R47_08015 [Chloroflexota bacterium]|nr:hypothetical protein [Chloroflexota bacterium]
MAKILFIVLAFALLIGLFPLSNHMLSMPGMKMDAMPASSQSNMGHESADEHSTSCCDAITPCSLGVFLLPQPTNIASYGGSKRVVSSAQTVQFIYIKSLSPPPKA